MAQPAEVLGAMITPAVLISAAALLLLSTANRLGRVIDRISEHLANAQRVHGRAERPTNYQHELELVQLEYLLRRLLLLRAAVTGMYLTMGLLLVTSISAGLNLLIPQIPALVPITLGVLGAVSFLGCIVALIREGFLAVQATLDEVDRIHSLLRMEERPQ